MSKRGQVAVLGLMIAVFVFLAAITFIEPMQNMISTARDSSNLDCENTSISTGQASTCLVVDLYLPYFIGAVLAAGVGFIFVRKVTG